MTVRPARRPRFPKVNLAEELIASMEEAVKIIAGELPPGRLHTALEIAAMAAAQATKPETRKAMPNGLHDPHRPVAAKVLASPPRGKGARS